MALSKEEIDEIQANAKEYFNGDLKLAAAAKVQGLGVVKKCGSKIVEWFDQEAINKVENEVRAALKTPRSRPSRKRKTK